ncbi:hypothetical protein P3X46_000673, partial [Hevea brasiliensis]
EVLLGITLLELGHEIPVSIHISAGLPGHRLFFFRFELLREVSNFTGPERLNFFKNMSLLGQLILVELHLPSISDM